MRVPDVLRQILDLTGVNQNTLAKRVGVSQGTVSKWIAEAQSPNKTQWDNVLDVIAADPRLAHLLVGAGGPSFIQVPVLPWDRLPGLVDAKASIPKDEYRLLPVANLGRGEFFGLEVQDDAMDRYSRPGSIIIVNKADRELMPDTRYVFCFDGGPCIYRSWFANPNRLEPASIGGQHDAVFISRMRDLAVIGRVYLSVLDLRSERD